MKNLLLIAALLITYANFAHASFFEKDDEGLPTKGIYVQHINIENSKFITVESCKMTKASIVELHDVKYKFQQYEAKLPNVYIYGPNHLDIRNYFKCEQLGKYKYYNAYSVHWAIYDASEGELISYLVGSLGTALFNAEDRAILSNLFINEGKTVPKSKITGLGTSNTLSTYFVESFEDYEERVSNILKMIETNYPGMRNADNAYRN